MSSEKLPENRQFWALQALVVHKFWTSVFKPDSFPNMWQNLVEFHAVISEEGVRDKGRQNARQYTCMCQLHARIIPFTCRGHLVIPYVPESIEAEHLSPSIVGNLGPQSGWFLTLGRFATVSSTDSLCYWSDKSGGHKRPPDRLLKRVAMVRYSVYMLVYILNSSRSADVHNLRWLTILRELCRPIIIERHA